MKPQAFLFDCDGTTVQSESLAMKVALDTAYGHFGKDYDPTLISFLSGKSFRQICDAVEENVGEKIPAAAYPALDKKQLHDTIAVLAADVTPVPGIVPQLQRLQTEGKPCAIVTSSPLERVEPCIDRVQDDGKTLRPYFPQVFSAEDPKIFPEGPRNKPDPSIYLHAAKTLGVEPGQSLAFEDSLSGVRSAVRAGIPVVAIVGADHITDKEARAGQLRAAAAQPGEGFQGVPDIIVMHHWDELPAVESALARSASYQDAVQLYNLENSREKSAPSKSAVPEAAYQRAPVAQSLTAADLHRAAARTQ
ncbi:MAG: HAD family phosphatase [Verrucomicrobium sp.]|nr:HAD family phosphatase [Verrucomicrobium sp.]